MNPGRVLGGRTAVVTAITGTVLIAAAAFWLSFTALADLADRSGVAGGQAWAWPLIVDGLIVVATVAAVALAGQRTAWYPWLLLGAGTVVSVTANALHATVAADADVPAVLAACVAAVPPLVLLASTHLTVVLVRSHTTPDTVAAPGTAAAMAPRRAEARVAADLPPAPEAESTSPPAVPEAESGSLPAAPEAREVPGLPGRRQLAASLRDEGWSNKAIARHLGVAPSTVGRWFAKPAVAGAPDGQETPKELAA